MARNIIKYILGLEYNNKFSNEYITIFYKRYDLFEAFIKNRN